MESLSVHDLQRLGTGTSSWQQGSELVGRLVFGNDAKTIVVLQDVNTFDAIQCRTDRFNPILEGTLVSIRHWIYVRYSDQVDLLEFMLENAYEVGVPDVTLSQKFHIQAQFASQILRPTACNFQTFDQLEQCPVDKAVSFAGMVAVKPATFCGRAMMQITNERGDRAIYLAFADDKQHQNFEIGTYYVFLNVEFAVVTDGDSRHNVFKYSASSRAYAITKEKYDDLKYAGAVDMQEDHDDEKHQPVVYTRSIESANMSVYIGTVTRVVDAMFGIYEMEGKTKHDKLLLCLFHYPDYRPLYPYRVGTKLQIHHTHMVAVQNIRPSLLQSWDAPVSQHSNVETCIFLVGCLRTHVQLVALPQNSDIQYGGDWISPQMLPAIYRESTEKRLDFASLLRCLDLYDAFSKKFESPRKAFISAKRLAQLTHYERRTAFGDVYHDILEHENGCSALGDLDGTTVELVQCLPLDAVVAKLLNENRRQIDDKNFAAKTSHLEQQNVEVLQAEYGIDNEDCRNLWVLGELLSSEQDGRLYLVDASCKVPLLIQNQTPENLPLDYLVLIKRMQVVQEDLSYKTEINGKTDKYCTYITCKATDILPARSPVRENGIPERLTSSDPLEISDIVGFKVENRKVSVILVLRVYPVTLTHDSDTTINTNINDHDPFYYKSSIRALRYPVNGPIHEMPTEISISLDSRSKSLKYWSQLQPGYFYVIEGDIDNGENCRVYKTFRKDLKIPRNINTAFKLDGVRHHLYPLVYAPNAGGEQLHAIISSSAPQTLINSLPRQRKIYQVRDLFLPLDDTRSPMRIETEKSWIEKPIDLQGVIIAKKFREIHAPKGLLYFRAQESLGRHGAGTGEPGRGLFFRVRQIDGLDTVDIYMNVSYRTWPLGLIPGSIVTFHNLFWKSIKNMNGFYCTAEAPTTWSVDVPSLERAEYILTTNIATRDLSEHNMANVESEKNLLYKTTCWIQHIIQMELQWQCLECGSFIKNDRCEGACSSNRRIFIAEAMARVEDEKGSAVAMFDGERLIMKLLGLTQRQADQLKETVRIRGPFFYGNWLDYGEQVDDEESSNDEEEAEEEENGQETKASPKLTLRDACQRIERGRQIYNLYVRRIIFKRPQGQKYESLLEHGLRKTTFYCKSGFFDCLTYKMSRLKVLELEQVSMAAHAWNYLAKMPQHH